MHRWWAGLLVVPYEAVGLTLTFFFAVMGLLLGLDLPSAHSDEDTGEASLMGALMKTPLGQVSGRLGQLLDTFRWLTGWLPSLLMVRRVRRMPPANTSIRLDDVVLLSIWSLFVCSLVALLTGLTGKHWYLLLAAWLIVISNMARQLSTVIPGHRDLPTRYKRSTQIPLVQFGMIAVADFATLTIAAVILLLWPSTNSFKWSWLPVEAWHLVTLAHLSEIWRLRFGPIRQLVIIIATILVMVLLVNQLKNWKIFRRSNSDKVAIAMDMLSAGDKAAAERWLTRVRINSNKDADMVRAQASWSLVEGDWETALRRARIYAQLRYEIADPHDAEDDALVTIGAWSIRYVINNCGFMTAEELFAFLIRHRITDKALVGLLPRPKIYRSDFWAREVEVLEQAASLTDAAYSLSKAVFDLLAQRYTDAEARLAKAPLKTAGDQLICEMLQMNIIACQSKEQTAYRKTVDDASGRIISGAQHWDIEKFPRWLRQWLSDQIYYYQSAKSARGDKVASRELKRIRSQLVGEKEAGKIPFSLTPLW